MVELRLPSSENRMSLLMPSVPTLPVVAHAEAFPDHSSIPVGYEFLDVFPKDLPGLPPDRDVEFAIELELVLLLFHSVPTAWLQRNWLR